MVKPLRIHGSVRFGGQGSAIGNLELEEINGNPANPAVSQVWHNLTNSRVGYCEKIANKIPVIRYFTHLDDLASLSGAINTLSAQIKQLASYSMGGGNPSYWEITEEIA